MHSRGTYQGLSGDVWLNLPGKKAAEGRMDENYAVLYQEFLSRTGEQGTGRTDRRENVYLQVVL